MSEFPKFMTRKSDQGRCVAVVGDLYRFLATGDETDGQYALWEAVIPPNGGPPPHTHSKEVEFFHVLEGEITFFVNGETLKAGPGMFAHMPIGSLHCFKNETETIVRMLIGVAPAGLEKMFFEVGQPLKSTVDTLPQPTQSDIDALLAVAERYGITIELPKE